MVLFCELLAQIQFVIVVLVLTTVSWCFILENIEGG